VQFEELLSLDPAELAQLAPVYGVIFLFKYPTDQPYVSAGERPKDGEYDYEASERLFFAAQTIQNACGTQALLSVLLNKVGGGGGDDKAATTATTIDVGDRLRDFRDFTMVLPPEFRGEALSNSELIRDVHNSFARASPFVDETQRTGDEEAEDAFHFVAYTCVDGTLYELDGLQPAPISHGPCSDSEHDNNPSHPNSFPARVVDVLQRRISRYGDAEIRFNLMAVVRDRRIGAREIGDLDALEREERRRRDWQFENALRRHNFVGFAAEVLKGAVATCLEEGGDAAFDVWVGDALKRRRAEEQARRSFKAGGAGGGDGKDVEMQG
jgi:ubiquitin carboxyl-terminal hydrolase L5